jgi:peroxiredoxin
VIDEEGKIEKIFRKVKAADHGKEILAAVSAKK